jgi:mRNA-degrading endonuclease toxin of MazEF toxin-antitoxin module
MSCSPGDLVGIPFPYSDLKTEKRRPVLVITKEDRHGDFICVAVTSVPATESAVTIDNASMKSGQLPRRSWIRCDKIFTLSKELVVRHYGSLDDDAFDSVKAEICAYLGCELS